MVTLETSPAAAFAAVPYQLKESAFGSHMLLLAALPANGTGRKVLDLGCCNGYFSALLADRGYQVTGVERPEGHGPNFPKQVSLVEQDLEKGLPRLDATYSYVVCADILEHLRNPLDLLRQAREHLEPNGQLVASLPNSGNFYFRLNVLAGRFPKQDRGLFDRTHVHFFPWSGWVGLFEEAGFQIQSVRSTSIPFSVALASAPAWLAKALEWFSYQAAQVWKTLFAYQFIVVAVPRGAQMSHTPEIVVVMPAYNAARTLQKTYAELPHDVVGRVIVVDDGSSDETVKIARELGLEIFVHNRNYGYGANQKTCYVQALKTSADIIVMVHPDYQYDPTLLPDVVKPIVDGGADVVLGSRLMGISPIKQGMPWWKYISNRFLTKVENVVFHLDLSEYHTGYRAYRREVLEAVNFGMNSDGFIFDQEIMAQFVALKARISEVPVPTRYFPQASSASFVQSSIYGTKILLLLIRYQLHLWGLVPYRAMDSLSRRYES